MTVVLIVSGVMLLIFSVLVLLDALSVSRNVLVVLERDDYIAELSLRNVPFVHILPADQLNAYDVLVSDDIVFSKGALDAFIAAKSGVESNKEEVNA